MLVAVKVDLLPPTPGTMWDRRWFQGQMLTKCWLQTVSGQMVGWSQGRPFGTSAIKVGVAPNTGFPQIMPCVLKMALLWVSSDGKVKCKSVFWLVPVAVSMFSSCQQQLTGQAHPCTAIVTAHWQTSDPAGPDNGKLLIFVGSTNLKWTTNVMSSIVLDSDNTREKSFRDCLYFLTVVFQNLTEYM